MSVDTDERLPPHDALVERNVLGSALIYPELISELDVTRDDFFVHSHQLIWHQLVGMAAEGDAISTDHLRVRLERNELIQRVGGLEYLLELTDVVPSRQPPVDILRKLSAQRALIGLSDKLRVASQRGDLASVGRLLKSVDSLYERTQQKPAPNPFVWRSTADLFQALSPVQWISSALQLCPGRPAMIAGYGSSAKTLTVQALALAVASGSRAFDFFPTAKGLVRHLDYEQGWRATARRYQRLALGHNISIEELEGRLEVAVLPSVYLDSADAVDAYSRACEGAQLVIIDAMRGATPSSDENDSGVRICMDNLTRVSERTGTAFLVLHHAGKPNDGHADKRTVPRGSSAIFDACGCVLVLEAGKTPNDPRRVSQVKPPAEAEGRAIDPFDLEVVDFTWDGNPTAGVRVLHKPIAKADTREKLREANAHDANELFQWVSRNEGLSVNQITMRGGFAEKRTPQLLRLLVEDRRLVEVSGPRGAKLYNVHKDHS